MNLMGKPRAQRSCRRMRNEVFDVEIKCWRDGEHHCTTFVCILLHINTDALTSGWEEKMQRCVVPKAPVSRPRRRSHASRPRSCPPRLFSPPPQSRPAPRGCPPCPPPQSRPAPRGCPPSPPPQSRPRGCPPSPPPQSPQSRPRGARGWLSAPAAVQAGTARLSAQSAAAVEAVQCSWDQAGLLGAAWVTRTTRWPLARLKRAGPAAKAAMGHKLPPYIES